MMHTKINVADKLALIQEHWSPKLIGQVNDTDIKLVKLQGEFVWHHHEAEDELFFVLKGRLLNTGNVINERTVQHVPAI